MYIFLKYKYQNILYIIVLHRILHCYIMFLYNEWFLKIYTDNYFLKGINLLSMISVLFFGKFFPIPYVILELATNTLGIFSKKLEELAKSILEKY